MSRLVPAKRLILTVAVLATFGAGLGACHQSPLHPSHGLRYKELWTAQTSNRPTRDAQAKGEEAVHAVRNYYNTYDNTNGSGAPSQSKGQMTAGVMPMH